MTMVPSRADYASFSYQVSPVPFATFRAEVLGLYQPPMRAKATHAKMRQVLDLVAELLGPDGTTADLTPNLVARFIASRPATECNNSTISLLSTLRAACSYGMQMGHLRISPFLVRKLGSWVRRERSKRARQHVSREEIARVLVKAKDEVRRKVRHSQAGPWAVWRCRRLHAVVATVAYTGLRKMECLRLKVEDVDLVGGFIHVVARQTSRLKTEASERTVPIAGPLAEVLREWIPYTGSEWLFPNSTHKAPWTGGSPGWKPLDRLRTLGQRARVPDLTFLCLRHSFATHALHWGLSAEQIARVMGHTNTRTQRGYQHDDNANLRGIADRIDFGPAEAEGGEK